MHTKQIHQLTASQGNSNLVMGSDEDPKDGGAVAGAVFGAVFIYIVRPRHALWPEAIIDTLHRASSSSAGFKPIFIYGRAAVVP
jgi:hypothetical protein